MFNLKSSVKKVLGFLLAVPILMGAAGCGSNSGPDTGPGSSRGSGTVSSEPAVTLTVEVFDRGLQGQPDLNNNVWTRYINDNFGKPNNITVEFVPVLRSQEVDKLNILMAANEAPDICFTYDSATITKYVKNDGITQLDDLLSEYGGDLTEYLGEEVLIYGRYNGNQMVVPAKRTVLADGGAFIRKDWLDKLDLPEPTTTDELYNTLIAFRDKNPGGVSNVIPWGISGTGVKENYGNLFESFWTEQSERDFVTTPGWLKPGNKEALKFLNKCYNENLISPDFAIDKTGKQFDADASNGNVGFFCCNWEYPWRTAPGIAKALEQNDPDAVFVPIDTFKNYEGKYKKITYSANGINVMIPKSSKNAVQAVKYLNWMADLEVIYYLQNGEEGVNHELVNGYPQPIPQTGDKMMISTQNLDYTLIVNGTELGDPDRNNQAVASTFAGYEDMAEKALKISMTDGYQPYFFDTPNEANGKYGKTLGDKNGDMTAKLIYCKPAEFDRLYDSLVQEYMDAGGKAVAEENIKIYDAMQANKK